MKYPTVKRDRLLRALKRFGVTIEEARGGGSGVKLFFEGNQTNIHCHPSIEVGPKIWVKTARDLGISPDELAEEF